MTPKKRVIFVVPGDEPVQIQGSHHLQRLKSYGEVTVYTNRPAIEEEKIERVKDADIIIQTRSAVTWPGEVLRALPKLRMIATCAVGTDEIDLTTASDMGIVVSNQRGRTAKVVAEHIFALMLAASKRAAVQTAELKAGRWTRMENLFLQGKTLGIVGTGNVGGELARLANALGMNVIAWTFHPSSQRAERLGVRFVELDDLLRRSDVVSLNLRLTDETREMIGEREFGLMKPGALFVNGGRGALADTGALVSALNSGHLMGAALDVYEAEPLPPGHPILACEQVVLTPHMADQTPEGMELLNEAVVDNAIAFLEGRPQNVVTP